MNFKIGDKVMYTGSKRRIEQSLPITKKGVVYHVSGVYTHPWDNSVYLILEEFDNQMCFYSKSFKKVDTIVTKEIALQFKEVKEKSDIEIQLPAECS